MFLSIFLANRFSEDAKNHFQNDFFSRIRNVVFFSILKIILPQLRPAFVSICNAPNCSHCLRLASIYPFLCHRPLCPLHRRGVLILRLLAMWRLLLTVYFCGGVKLFELNVFWPRIEINQFLNYLNCLNFIKIFYVDWFWNDEVRYGSFIEHK